MCASSVSLVEAGLNVCLQQRQLYFGKLHDSCHKIRADVKEICSSRSRPRALPTCNICFGKLSLLLSKPAFSVKKQLLTNDRSD